MPKTQLPKWPTSPGARTVGTVDWPGVDAEVAKGGLCGAHVEVGKRLLECRIRCSQTFGVAIPREVRPVISGGERLPIAVSQCGREPRVHDEGRDRAELGVFVADHVGRHVADDRKPGAFAVEAEDLADAPGGAFEGGFVVERDRRVQPNVFGGAASVSAGGGVADIGMPSVKAPLVR